MKEKLREIEKITRDLSEIFSACSEKFMDLTKLLESLQNSDLVIDNTEEDNTDNFYFSGEDSNKNKDDILVLDERQNTGQFVGYEFYPDTDDVNDEDLSIKSDVSDNTIKLRGDYKSKVNKEFELIEEGINKLESNSSSMYPNTEFSISITNVKNSFMNFKKELINNIDLSNSEETMLQIIRKLLLKGLDRYGWAGTFLRIYAYACIEQFKGNNEKFLYGDIRGAILTIGENIKNVYKDNDIEVVLPNLLKDTYNEKLYIYDNSNEPLIRRFCEISQNNYSGEKLIYDLVEPGYMISNEEESQKPKVFYLS